MSDIGYPDAKQMDTRSTVAEMRDLVRRMRKEIIALETEVGELCKKLTKLEAELKLLRGGDHASD